MLSTLKSSVFGNIEQAALQAMAGPCMALCTQQSLPWPALGTETMALSLPSCTAMLYLDVHGHQTAWHGEGRAGWGNFCLRAAGGQKEVNVSSACPCPWFHVGVTASSGAHGISIFHARSIISPTSLLQETQCLEADLHAEG